MSTLDSILASILTSFWRSCVIWHSVHKEELDSKKIKNLTLLCSVKIRNIDLATTLHVKANKKCPSIKRQMKNNCRRILLGLPVTVYVYEGRGTEHTESFHHLHLSI